MNKITCETCLLLDEKGQCRLNPQPYSIPSMNHYCSHHTGWDTHIKAVRKEMDAANKVNTPLGSTIDLSKKYSCECLHTVPGPKSKLLYQNILSMSYIYSHSDCVNCQGTGMDKTKESKDV